MQEKMVGKYKVKVTQDDAIDPREWDNVGIMLCAHGRYNLGDRQYNSAETLDRVAFGDNVVARFPLYLMDHTILTMKTTPFGGYYGRFDSGQVGYIVATEEQCEKMGLDPENKEQLDRILGSEVETYNHYLRGDCFGYQIIDTETDEFMDGCGGYIGEPSLPLEEGVAQAERLVEQDQKEQDKLEQSIVFMGGLS